MGRYWGWFNRKNIPYAELIETVVEIKWNEYRRFRWDMGEVFSHARKSMLSHALKLYWFYDFIEPVMMLIDGLDGRKVLGWGVSDRHRRDLSIG